MKPLFNLKKAGLLAVTASLLLTACKKDKDNTENPTPLGNSAQLKKVSKGSDVLEFTYGTDGAVKSVNLNDDFTTGGTLTTFAVTYGTDKKVSELKAADGTRIVAHYTGAELSSADMYDGNNLALTSRYEYLNGFLKSITSSVGGTDALKFSFSYDAAGNVSRMNTWMVGATGQLASTGYNDYIYDGKTNPMNAHKALLYLLLQNTPKSNIAKETEFNAQGTVTETTEYTYQYNSQNLPQSATVKTTLPGQQPTTSTLTYSYQ